MANLPENTSYNSSGSSMPTGINFSNLLKNIQQKTQNTSSEVVRNATPVATPTITTAPTISTPTGVQNNKIPNPTNPLDTFAKMFGPPVTSSPSPSITPYPITDHSMDLLPRTSISDFSKLFGPPTTTSVNPNTGNYSVPINTPIGTQNPGLTKTEPLPSGYFQFTPTNSKGNWAAPSDKAVIRDWPTALGGGQYIVDPSQPGKMIKSNRTIMDDVQNPGAKQKVLGNLSPSLYQVDHIVPLWVGGADTLANLQILDNIEHEKKTAIQAVPLTLLSNGKISLEEARQMALTWNEKDATGLPSDAEITKLGGFVPLNVAENYAQKWKDDVGKVDTWKYFGDAFKENMMNFGKNIPILGEFAKGLVGGATAGIVPGTGASPDSGAVGTVSNIAGNVVGSLTGLGLLGEGVGAVRGALGGAKVVEGIGNGINIANDVMKTANLVPDIGSLAPSTFSAVNRATTLSKMASSAGLLSLWGQIGVTGRELTGQEDVTFKNHVSQFLTDVAYGSLLGSAGQTVRGYATVGLGSTAFSLMQGNSIVPALQDGALMTALHGLGYKKGLVDPKITTGNEEAYKMATTVFNNYLGDTIPLVNKGEVIPTILKLDIPKIEQIRLDYQNQYPHDQRFTNTQPITNDAEAISFLGNAAKRNLGNIIARSDGNIPQDDIKKEMTRIITAQNTLMNQTLPPEIRAQKEMKDLYSLGEKLRLQIKTDQARSVTNSTSLLNNVPFNLPTDILPNVEGETFPTGPMSSTGYGGTTDPISNKTVNDFYANPSNYSKNIFLVKDPDTKNFMSYVKQEKIAASKDPKSKEYKKTIDGKGLDNPLRIFIKDASGKLHPAGYHPSEDNISRRDGINKAYFDATERIKSKISSASSPEELRDLLSKDPAIINLTREEAINIFNNKKTILSKTDSDFYDQLHPETPLGTKENNYGRYDTSLNNETISSMMDKHGINVLPVDVNKLMPTGGAFPRLDPNNPYLSFNITEQNWLRAKDMKNGVPPAYNAEVNKGVDNTISKQKSQNMAKTAGNILDRINTSEISPERIQAEPQSESVVPSEESINKFTPAEIKKFKKEGFSDALIKIMETKDITKNPFLENRLPFHTENISKVETTPKVETEKPIEISKEVSPEEETKREEYPDPRKFVKPIGSEVGVDAGVYHYIKDPEIIKNYTKENLTKFAKEVSNNGQDVADGWPKYLAQRESDIQKATGNPDFHITNPKELRDTRWRYQRLADSSSRKEIFKENGKTTLIDGDSDNTGVADGAIQNYIKKYNEVNKDNKLPEDSMQIVSINKNTQYNVAFGQSTDKMLENDDAAKNINGKKFLPLGGTGKTIDKDQYVQYEPKLVEKFNEGPSKYLTKDDRKMTNDDKFMRVFIVDVLNLPKETSYDDFTKRAALLYNRGDKYIEQDKNANPNFKLKILKSPLIKEFPELNLNKEQFLDPEHPAVAKTIAKYGDGNVIDGEVYMGENLAPRIVRGLALDPVDNKTGMKLNINGEDINSGSKLIHKGHFSVVDPATREMLKRVYGYDMSPDEMVSFDTNAKIGPKDGAYELPMSSIYGKNLTAGHEVTMKVSGENKFLSEDSGVKEDMLDKLKEKIPGFESFNEELEKTKTNEELKQAIDKFSDEYNINKDDLFFGTLGKTLELGGGKINLSHNIESVLKNLYHNYVLFPETKNSTNAFLVSPLQLPLDGADKPIRFLNNKEVMLGEEAIKNLNAKEGDTVLISRDPNFDINNSVVAKIINGTKYGQTSLGADRAAVSAFNERLKLGGDQDGDKIKISKVGEGGVPKSYTDAVEARGSKAIPFTEVNSREKGPVTMENINKSRFAQKVGDDQTIEVSKMNRIGDTMQVNKLTLKVYPSEKKADRKESSKYEILSNGHVVETGTTVPSRKEFTAIPSWGPEERHIRTQALQEAVDSKKSDDILKTTNNDPDWMLKQVFHVADGKTVTRPDTWQARSIKGSLRNFQKGFEPEKVSERNSNLYGVQQELKPFNDMTQKIKDAGGEVTPWQEKSLQASKVKSFHVPDNVKVDADRLGAEAVKKQVKNVDLNTPELRAFQKAVFDLKQFTLARGAGTKEISKEKVKEFNEKYLNNTDNGKYSQKAIDAIAYWAATAPEANVAHGFMDNGKMFPNPKYIYRLNTIINRSPSVAKAYLEGSENIDIPKPVEDVKKDGQGGPYDGQGGPTPQGEVVIIARHGSTGRNGEKVFRGWEETKENQLTPVGREEAKKLGEELKQEINKKELEDYIIVSSDLNRAKETAKIVSKITGIKIGKSYSDLRSQDTGDFTGKKESDCKGEITKFIDETPNKPLPGASESYNQFVNRIKSAFSDKGKIEKENPGKKIIVIVHHQVDVLQKNNFNKATDAMFSAGIKPGGHRYISKHDGKGGLLSNAWDSLKQNILGPIGSAVSDMPAAIKPVINPSPVIKPIPITPSLDTKKFLDSIASNETSVVKGNPYDWSQSSGSPTLGMARGRYNVTDGDLKTYGPRYLGKSVTPQEFQKSKTLQDTYMTNKALYLNKQGYTPQQIADIHNKGLKKESTPGSAQYQNPDYVKKFNLNYNATTSPDVATTI